jgi:hypothetical protein
MPKKSTRPRDLPQPEAPAVITPLHRKDRLISPTAGAPKGYRKLTPLEATYAKNQLAGGSERHLAQDRFDAGQRYSELFDLAQVTGRDSTQALNLSGGGAGLPLSVAQSEAITALVCVESHLGARDRQIIRMVCGMGNWPSEAVSQIYSGDYKFTTMARFRESLDALIEAFETARRYPGRVKL